MAYPGSSGGASYMVGFNELIGNTNAEILKIRTASLAGMVKAAAFMRNRTEHAAPKTPRRLGNLVHSWFVVTATRTHSGDRAMFAGKKASKMASEHSMAIAEKRAEAAAISRASMQILVMGYSANYAGFLHESMIATKFTRPKSGVKWFEHHFKANKDQILQIIATNIRIK